MANTIEVNYILDDSRNLVAHCHIDGDGSGDEAYSTVIDASALNYSFSKFKLMEVSSNLIGFSCELTAEGTPRSSGTTDGVGASKLIDSGADFVTDGVAVGDFVFNTTDSTECIVTAIDSATQLSISENIMASGEGYEIAGKQHIWVCPDYEQDKDFTKFGGIPNTLRLPSPTGDITITTAGLGAGDTGHIILTFRKVNSVKT